MLIINWKKKFIGIFYPLILEALIVLLILTISLCIEFYSRNLLNKVFFLEIIKSSLTISFVYIVLFRLIKSGVFILSNLVIPTSQPRESEKIGILGYLIDVFSTLFFILISAPIRPILQDAQYIENVPYFDQALVKFDAIPSVILLSIVAIPIIILLIKKYDGFIRMASVFGVMAAIIFAGIYNNKPNYYARVYESRANWIKREWSEQETDAGKALKDAKTDSERAVAYYWLGVSVNRQGNYKEAIQYQLKAIELDPMYGAPHSSLALAYLRNNSGDLEKAKVHADKCIILSPDYAWCYYALAAYYDYNGERLKSYENLKKALKLDPNDLDIKNSLDQFKINNPGIENQTY